MTINLRKFIPGSPQRVLTNLLLYRHRTLQFGVLIIGALVVAAIFALVVFRDPSPGFDNPNRALHLQTNIIDTLELWVEERQTAYEEGIKLPPRTLFTIPSP